jgi:hypothetical protein
MGISFPSSKGKKGFKTHSIVLTPSWLNNQSKEAKSFYKHILNGTKIIAIFFFPSKLFILVYPALQSSSIGALHSFSFAFVSYLSTWLMGAHPHHLYV